MRPDDKDMARLWDMLDAARAGVQFTEGLRLEDLLANRLLRNAVERTIEIVGEAARHVSAETRDLHPDIPWRSIIGLRNVLAHDYDEIRHEILWRLCKDELPLLIRQLEATDANNPPQGDER